MYKFLYNLLMTIVTPLAEARAGLSKSVAAFRADPATPPVVMGAHRKPEAVLMSYADFVWRPTAPRAAPLLDVVTRKIPLLRRLADLNHISAVAVFGSVARGEETAESDIDLLVDPDDRATLFDLAQFEIDLEAVFDRSVDVISRRSLVDRDSTLVEGSIALWRATV